MLWYFITYECQRERNDSQLKSASNLFKDADSILTAV